MKPIPKYHYNFSLNKHRAACYIEYTYAKYPDKSYHYRYRKSIVNIAVLKRHQLNRKKFDRLVPFYLNRCEDTICHRIDRIYKNDSLYTCMQKFMFRCKKWAACCE